MAEKLPFAPTRSERNILRVLHGELDISKKHAIEKELGRIERLMAAGVVILDLSDVGYLDTTFLNALLRTELRVPQTAEARLRIVAPSTSFVSRVFAVTKLDARFKLFDDVSAAERYRA